MDMFEKVEKLQEKANVSFEEAKAALEEANGDLLDAIIILERQGKVKAGKESYSTEFEKQVPLVVENPNNEKKKSSAFVDKLRALWHKSCENYFVVEHKGEQTVKVPIWAFIIILILTWEVSLVILIVGLFLGCRYSFKGEAEMNAANKVMNKASEAAEKVKDEFDKL